MVDLIMMQAFNILLNNLCALISKENEINI